MLLGLTGPALGGEDGEETARAPFAAVVQEAAELDVLPARPHAERLGGSPAGYLARPRPLRRLGPSAHQRMLALVGA